MRKISEVRVVDAKTGGVINCVKLCDFEEPGKLRTYEDCLRMARAVAREKADR